MEDFNHQYSNLTQCQNDPKEQSPDKTGLKMTKQGGAKLWQQFIYEICQEVCVQLARSDLAGLEIANMHKNINNSYQTSFYFKNIRDKRLAGLCETQTTSVLRTKVDRQRAPKFREIFSIPPLKCPFETCSPSGVSRLEGLSIISTAFQR